MNVKRLFSLFAASTLACLAAETVQGQTVFVSDTYTTTNNLDGFALGYGVNTSINPPITNRMTGTVAANLRYLQTGTARGTNNYNINSNRLRVETENTIGRFTLSANGSTPYDFSPALGVLYASPTNLAIYELRISMRNNASTAARFAFALATAETDANSWDFGVQLYHANTAHDYYTMQRRIDSASSSGGADVNLAMGTTAPGTWNTNTPATINFLIRVTDAGLETDTNYNSRVQVSIDNGANWIYDTSGDIGFRFDGTGRYIIFDQAANTSGSVFYDNFSLTMISPPVTPSERTWTGGGLDDNWSTPNNWGGNALTTGNPLIFAGTSRQTNNNDLNELVAQSITFNNGGFSLSGIPFTNTLSVSNVAGVNIFAGEWAWTSTAAKSWQIAGGSEVQVNGVNNVEVNGDHSLTGGGTLRVKGTMNIGQATTANPALIINEGQHIVDGGTFASRGGYRIGSQATGAGAKTILTNSASFSLTASGANLRVGDSANPVASQLLINNSTLTLTGGSLAVPYAAGAAGTVSQAGGTVSGGSVIFNDNGAGNGLYQIVNGTLEPIQIRDDTAAGSSAIHFDNAVLRTASGANSNFFSGVDVAEIQAGGLTIDASADVTIAQVLSGTGTLTKTGSSGVTLTGANIYSGNTVIQSGKLSLPTTQTNATTAQVADGAELGVNVRSVGSTLSIPTVNFNGSANTLSFDLGSFTTPTAPLMKIVNLSLSGSVGIVIANGLQLTTGQIVLVDYDGSIGGGFNFTLNSLPPGVTATLVNNTANSSIDLNITGVPGFRWTGATSGDWDTTTENWISQQTGLPSAYSDGFPTAFQDGATTGNVNITGFPAPSVITVSNNTQLYIWSNGSVTTPLLKKSGTNALVRVETSPDVINTIELNAGVFVASNFFDASFSTVLADTSAGLGTFVKQGASTLTVSTNSGTFDGAILVQQGTLKLSSTGALGSTNGSTTIASGATLDLNDITAPHEPVIVSGSGVGGVGAIIDSTTGGAVAHNLTDVTMAGDTVFGAPSGGRWDIRVRSSSGPGPGLKGNGFKLTKVGSGTLSIACQRSLGTNTPYWQMNLGDIFVNEGGLTFAESLSLGNPSRTINVGPGASLGTFDLNITNPIVRPVIVTDGTITGGGGASDTNLFTGPIQVVGTAHLRPLDAKLLIDGVISGSGAVNVSANAAGGLYLNGMNTYTGDTTVTNGVFGGSGVIPANLVMLGGALSPGMGFGTLTVNGNATLAGSTDMELNRSLSPNSDRLVVGGTLNFGGVLNVVLGAGAPAPQAGDVYQLFNKGSGSSFSAVSLPNLSGLPGGLAWDTSNLNVNGTITVTGTATPPTISNVSVNGNDLIFSGTGGVEGNSYTVLSSTNVALPLANWTPVSTNVFGTGGSFSVTNTITPALPQSFFTIRVP